MRDKCSIEIISLSDREENKMDFIPLFNLMVQPVFSHDIITWEQAGLYASRSSSGPIHRQSDEPEIMVAQRTERLEIYIKCHIR
jgi:hypothetical protein